MISQARLERLLDARVPILIFWLLLIGAMAFGATKLQFTNDYKAFFGADNPQLNAFEDLQRTYVRSDNILVMLRPESGEVFDERTLTAVLELTERAWQLPYVLRVDSISNYQYSYGLEDELVIEELIPEPDYRPLDELKQIALEQPLLVGRLLSEDTAATAVNIAFRLPGVEPLTETPEIVSAIQSLIADINEQYPDIEVFETGVVMLNDALANATFNDIVTLIPAIYVLVAVSVALFMRSIGATVITGIVVTLSIGGAMGMAGWFGIMLTPPSASVPPIIMTLAVADCIHMLKTTQQRMVAGLSQREAIIDSLRLNIVPVVLTSVTTAVGFLTLNFSDAPPFQHLGNMAAVGVIIACIMSLTLLPVLMTWMPVSKSWLVVREESEQGIPARLTNFMLKHYRRVLIGFLIVVIPVLALIPNNQLNDNFVQYFDQSFDFRTDTDAIEESLTSMTVIDYSLNSGQSEGIAGLDYLRDVERLEQWLYEQPEVIHVNSIVEILRRLNQNLHEENPEFYRLPDDRAAVNQFLLLYEMSLPPGLDLNDQINVDKSETRLTVTIDNLSSSATRDFERRVYDWMSAETPQLVTEGTGPSMMFTHISLRNIKSMMTGTVMMFFLISLVLIIAYRSLNLGLISLVANMIPAGIAFGLWAVTVGDVSLGVSVVGAMTMGIVVDDSIHFLSKYRYARLFDKLDPATAIRKTYSTVGVAITGTTVILVMGFLVMAYSPFQVNSHMGALSATTIALALLIDLFIVPALLLRFDRDKNTAVAAA